MRFVVVIMTGIGFTFGVLIGLFVQLPVDTLPAGDNFLHSQGNMRHRRSLSGLEGSVGQFTIPSDSKVSDHVAKALPLRTPDHVIGLGSFVPSVNGVGKKDTLDVNWKQRSRNADRVQSNYGESKQNSHSLHPDKDSVVQGGDKLDGAGQASVSITVKVKSNSKVAMPVEDNQQESTGANSHSSSDQVVDLRQMTSGIHWARDLEGLCPKGFTSADSDSWRIKSRSAHIVKMEEGCGRMQNRLVTFDDASKACVRYRLNTDQIQGEIYSYYLAKLLNMTNLPPSVLHRVDRVSDQWKDVHLEFSDSQWADGKIVILTQWIDQLSPAYIPDTLKEDTRRLHPVDSSLRGKSQSEVCDLVQWSDLIVFDYLTANLDRMVNNMFNRQWNEQMMNNPAHNLERNPSGKLLFLDNESGLFHGYRLLDKYASYHSALLKSVCVFRRGTVQAVKKLYKSENIGEELQKLFSADEELHSSFPQIPQKNIKVLKARLKDVYDQMSRCEMQYGQ